MFSKDYDRETFAKNLQDRLHILRAAAKVSQTEAAEALGLVRSTYANYEKGKKEIPWEKCLAMLFYFESNPNSRELLKSLQLLPDQEEQA